MQNLILVGVFPVLYPALFLVLSVVLSAAVAIISYQSVSVLAKHNDELLKQPKFTYLLAVMVLSMLVVFRGFMISPESMVYVIPLLISGFINAYTDFNSKRIFDIVNIAAFALGMGFMVCKDIRLMAGVMYLVPFLVLLYVCGCMKWGDMELLLSGYPFIACLINHDNFINVFFFLCIMAAALIFSLIANGKEIIKDIHYSTYYAPFHMAALIVFLIVFPYGG